VLGVLTWIGGLNMLSGCELIDTVVYLQTTYELCFGEAYFEYFESCDFSHENTNIEAYRCIRVYV
jgi:hypothetical protein